MSEKKLTIAQKRDRDTAALIAEVQKTYEDRIEALIERNKADSIRTNAENYTLGYDQGYKTAEAVYNAQSVIDRLLKKAI